LIFKGTVPDYYEFHTFLFFFYLMELYTSTLLSPTETQEPFAQVFRVFFVFNLSVSR